MNFDEILIDYVNQKGKEKYTRKINRLWASDINSIRKGYLTVENFFEPRKIDIAGVRNILVGVAMEDMLTKIFKDQKVDALPQEKKVIKIDEDIELVVKPDYVFPDFVLETKFPFSIVNPYDIPERYKAQLECEARAFNREAYLGVFSIPFSVTFIPYANSKRRWANIQKLLKKFHAELVTYVEQDRKTEG